MTVYALDEKFVNGHEIVFIADSAAQYNGYLPVAEFRVMSVKVGLFDADAVDDSIERFAASDFALAERAFHQRCTQPEHATGLSKGLASYAITGS